MTQEILDKRTKIMDTTLTLVLQEGIQGTSMGKISKVSGVAVGTIYHYFSSKEDLFTQMYRAISLKMLTALDDIPQGETFYDAYYNCTKRFIEYALSHPDEHEFMDQYSRSPIIDKKVKIEVEDCFRRRHGYAAKYIKSTSSIPDFPDEIIDIYIRSALSGFIRAMIFGEIKPTEQLIDLFIDIIWQGFAKAS